MSEAPLPAACADCLRRAWLIGSLAGHIERAASDSPGRRAHELLALPEEELARAMARSEAKSFLERAASRDVDRLQAAVADADAWACCTHDHLYPDALRDLGDPPSVLFGRGDSTRFADVDAEHAVTIVGSRRPSGYGRDVATALGRDLAAAGLPVISGMALGIDSCAHRGALEAGGLTIAVLGTGVDVPYPPRFARLYEEIVERGLVIGELPPGSAPRRWTFPARNRIMAALGAMTIVVEARERSGSLITAEMAGELGRQLGAVPGRVGASSAAGTNGMLRDGAAVIRGAQDVLDALLPVGATEVTGFAARGPRLDPDLAKLLELVEGGVATPDALCRGSGLAPGPLAAGLVRLELSGYVRADSAGRYERTSLAMPDSA